MSDLRSQSTYSYPSPATNTTLPRTDISLREILDTYRDNNDLLKQILSAKVEEDRRRAEEEKSEQLRLQCKQVELEMLREQKKPTIYTGVPPINTSTSGFNVKSPSDVHSPYLSIPPPIDTHFPATTPTSATQRLSSPPTSATAGHDYNGHNHYSTMNQRPSLTLSIPSFPIITSSPTAMHNNHSFSTPTSSIPEHPHSATSQTHHYSHSPTSINSNNKRTKMSSESEVDHEYVMEALRQKLQRNQENPAKKFMNVLKPRSASMPVPPLNQPSPQQQHHPSHHHHSNRDQHKQQSPHRSQQAPSPSPVDSAPMVHSPIPPQLPPMNVHSPSMNQEQVAKS